MAKSDESVKAIREFNRFYTARIGALDEGFHKSPLPLPEARTLREIAVADYTTASDLASELRLDLGYVSRLVGKLEDRGLVRRRPSPDDARANHISLTAAGRKQFAVLDRQTIEEVSAMCDSLSPSESKRLVEAMLSIQSILDRPKDSRDRVPAFVLRPHRAGDMGWVVHRQALLYAREYGWDNQYEALASRIVADFLEHYEPAKERCWIAERDNEMLGCVFLLKDRSSDAAQLRLLHVEQSARGMGVGRALVAQCTHFARQAGYDRIILWTNSVLASARRIYEGEGYKLVKEEAHTSFGKDLHGQYWELRLSETQS